MELLRELPLEVVVHVLSFLPPRDLCQWAQVNSNWRHLVNSESIWRKLCHLYNYTSEFLVPLPQNEKVGSLEEECVHKRLFARGAMSGRNWKRKKYKEVRLGGVNRSLSAVAYLGNGAVLATLADDGTLSLYDVNYSTKPIQQLSHLGEEYSYGVRGGGDRLAVSLTKGEELYLACYKLVRGILVGGRLVAVTSPPGLAGVQIKQIDKPSPSVQLLTRYSCRVYALLEQSLAVSVWDRNLNTVHILIYSPELDSETYRFQYKTWSYSAGQLYLMEDYSIRVSDLHGRTLRTLPTSLPLQDASFFFNSSLIVLQTKNRKVTYWTRGEEDLRKEVLLSSEVLAIHPILEAVIHQEVGRGGVLELRLTQLSTNTLLWRSYLYENQSPSATHFSLYCKVISSSVLFYVPLLHTGLTDWFVIDLTNGDTLYHISAQQSFFVQAVNDKLIEFKDVRSDPSVVRLLVFTPLSDS